MKTSSYGKDPVREQPLAAHAQDIDCGKLLWEKTVDVKGPAEDVKAVVTYKMKISRYENCVIYTYLESPDRTEGKPVTVQLISAGAAKIGGVTIEPFSSDSNGLNVATHPGIPKKEESGPEARPVTMYQGEFFVAVTDCKDAKIVQYIRETSFTQVLPNDPVPSTKNKEAKWNPDGPIPYAGTVPPPRIQIALLLQTSRASKSFLQSEAQGCKFQRVQRLSS